MAHFTRIRELGMWLVSIFEPYEMELFDEHQAKAVNGDDGGAWAPTSPISLGGTSGLELSSSTPLVASGDVTIGTLGATTLQVLANTEQQAGSALSSNGTFVHNNTTSGSFESKASQSQFVGITCSGGVTVAAASIFQSSVAIGDSATAGLIVYGPLVGTGLVTATAGLTVTSGQTLTAAGPVNVSGAVSLTGAVTPGTGGYIKRRSTNIGTTGQTVSIENYDIVRVTSAGEISLADYGDDGAVIRIINAHGSNTLAVKTAGGVTLIVLASQTWVDAMRLAAGFYGWRNVGSGTAIDFS